MEGIPMAAAGFLVGLVLVVKGGDWFVNAAVWVAQAARIPALLIGATIVSLCTALPEYAVSTLSVASGAPALGIGNAVGSLLCNTGLVLPLTYLFRPQGIGRKTLVARGGLLLLALGLLWILLLDGRLAPWEGLLFLCLAAGYVVYCLREARQARAEPMAGPSCPAPRRERWKRAAALLGSALAIVAGARLLVDHGVRLAQALGASQQLIGLTLTALGTALPELVTTLAALIKGEYGLSLGNILGANILGATLILPTGALVAAHGLELEAQHVWGFAQPLWQTLWLDLPALLLITGVLLLPSMRTHRLARWQGVAALLLYGGYLALLAASAAL